MKSMMIRQVTQKVLSLLLLIGIGSTYSMVCFAAPGKAIGELIVSGSAADGSSVTVNGEPAKSGRTLFPNSTISTPDGADAVISLGSAGKVRLSGGTTFTVSGDSALGDLTAGKITLLSSAGGLNIKTLSGETVKMTSGETVSANSTAAARQTGPGGLDWWKWALIVGGVITVIVVAAAVSGDDESPVSPIR